MASAQKEAFFSDMDAAHLALTFDDVLVDPARSYVGVNEVNTTSRFSRNVELKIPMVSAAMDRVTTSDMAIAMAMLGGIGVIHAAQTVEDQKREVRAVKLRLNPLIERPITVKANQRIESVLKRCDKRGYNFRSFPVLDVDGKLVGVLTNDNIDFADSPQRRVKSVMTPLEEVIQAPVGTTIEKAYKLMAKRQKKMLPLVDEFGAVQGLYVWSDVKRIVRGNAAHYNVDNEGRLRVAAAIPTDEEGIERVHEMAHYLDAVVLDTAQGDSKYIFPILEKLKAEFPQLDVVAGNVSVGPSARDLAEAGADGIKVGQGPGSICTTRPETGMGRPQVTAVHDCARAVDKYDVPICADGGIAQRGDIMIALAAGGHSVMMGNMLAGTDEAPGQVISHNGKQVMSYRGQGSSSALRDSPSNRKRYAQGANYEPLPEGIEAYVPYKGSVHRVVGELVKALRKGMTYVGADTIDYLRTESTLTRITNNGARESLPHDVMVL
jgi:IMP dehydrogenase